MSDIDMQSFSSGVTNSAAESQSDFNSYLSESNSDYPVVDEFLSPPVPEAQAPQAQVADRTPSQQEWNFKALRDEVETKKSEIAELRQNVEFLKNHMQRELPRRQEEVADPKRAFDLDQSEIPNVGEIERAWGKHEVQLAQRESALRDQMEEIMVAQRYPDYAEVMEKHTSALLKDKPFLAEGIRAASNKALYAYELGKMMQAQRAQQTALETPTEASKPQVNSNAQRMVDNARKPRTLAQAGGQNVLSQADYYANMSDKQFAEFASKNFD